ncbi:MAG: pyridoxamine 5'-phosphate oxidase family protein [Pseudomonadota bacterium]
MRHPLDLFADDRARARAAEDPMAHLCTVANTDAEGQPQLRTLVLRDVDDRLALFINATSPKWPSLQAGFAVMTYWPSVQIQYRLQVTAEPLAAETVHASWLQRPPAPQRMDWFYQQVQPQSSVINSREALLANLLKVEVPAPLKAPNNARGVLLNIAELERLDLNQPDGVHLRERFIWNDDQWQQTVLVP